MAAEPAGHLGSANLNPRPSSMRTQHPYRVSSRRGRHTHVSKHAGVDPMVRFRARAWPGPPGSLALRGAVASPSGGADIPSGALRALIHGRGRVLGGPAVYPALRRRSLPDLTTTYGGADVGVRRSHPKRVMPARRRRAMVRSVIRMRPSDMAGRIRTTERTIALRRRAGSTLFG